MCTAVSWNSSHHYFGRNLDLDYSYNETVTVTPRNFPLRFRMMPDIGSHYAIIGAAVVMEDYPLYYDAVNEKGLCMAGLNFPKSAHYASGKSGFDNIAPFEFIPWILSQCSCVQEAKILLQRIHLVDVAFSEQLPLTPLHWIIADCQTAVTVEATVHGLHIYENDIGILTNEPPFPYHLSHLQNYMHVSAAPASNLFSGSYQLESHSVGSGSIGLPGDYSSGSRFVRAAFVKLNSVLGEAHNSELSQFFHILDSVSMPLGCVQVPNQKYEFTRYSSCCDTNLGIYYYTTYDNKQITAVNMFHENIEASRLISYPMITHNTIHHQN